MTMATRIAVLERGALMQVGTPAEVYEYPSSRFVAEFLGTANVFEGIVRDPLRIESVADDTWFVPDAPAPKPEGGRVWVAVRPEKMRLRRAGEGEVAGENRIVGEVQDIAYYGDFFVFVVARDDGATLRVSQPNLDRITELPVSWGDRVTVTWPAHANVVLPE